MFLIGRKYWFHCGCFNWDKMSNYIHICCPLTGFASWCEVWNDFWLWSLLLHGWWRWHDLWGHFIRPCLMLYVHVQVLPTNLPPFLSHLLWQWARSRCGVAALAPPGASPAAAPSPCPLCPAWGLSGSGQTTSQLSASCQRLLLSSRWWC